MGWLPDGRSGCRRRWRPPTSSPASTTPTTSPPCGGPRRRSRSTRRTGRRFHIGAHGNPVYREVFSPPRDLGRRLHAGGAADRAGRRGALPGRRHASRPARPRQRLLLPERPGARPARLAGPGAREHPLHRYRRASRGRRAGRLPRRPAGLHAVSLHEAGRWPFTGAVADRAGGHARNLPVPAGFNDSEMLWLLHQAILPMSGTCGRRRSCCRPAPTRWRRTRCRAWRCPTTRIGRVVRALMGLAPRLIVLGGGGYNPWSVGRCWAASGRC